MRGVVVLMGLVLTALGCGVPAPTSACPNGGACVHFVGGSSSGVGGNGGGDPTTPPAGDMATAKAAADMASAPPPADLSLPAMADMARAGDMTSCVPTGGDCTSHDDAVCCSKYCVYATNTCR